MVPFAVLVVLVASLVVVPGASAVTCADYRGQGAAQRAADTRNIDGEGVFCESLADEVPAGARS